MKTLIQTPTNDLKNSIEFYSKLKFNIISDKDPVLVSDGKAFIQINPDRYARAGIKLFRSEWKEAVNELSKLAKVVKTNDGFLLTDTSGMWIYLIETDTSFDLQISETSDSVLGNYMGIGLETPEAEKSKEIWSILGFERNDPKWPSFTNIDQVTITLYEPNSCPHLFFNPSLTYFNGPENLKVIDYIRQQNIPIAEEITYFNPNNEVDNIIIRDPGGLGFFLFND